MNTTTKLDQLIADLRSNEMSKALIAVKDLKEHGTKDALEPLIDVWCANKDNKLGSSIERLMGSLKATDGTDIIIKSVTSTNDFEMKTNLLSCLWNAGIDCSDYLQTIIEVALKEDYHTGVECMTLVENMEGPFEEAQLMESLIQLRLIVQKDSECEAIYKVLLSNLERAERNQ
ncbi:MAG: hypothetical protein ACJAUV_001986 [Flavobacteriales bacterium]